MGLLKKIRVDAKSTHLHSAEDPFFTIFQKRFVLRGRNCWNPWTSKTTTSRSTDKPNDKTRKQETACQQWSAGTHPLVLVIVTIGDVGDGPGRVQGFGVSYQRPAETHVQHLCKKASCLNMSEQQTQQAFRNTAQLERVENLWLVRYDLHLDFHCCIPTSAASASTAQTDSHSWTQEEFRLAIWVIQTWERHWNVANSNSVLPTSFQSVLISLEATSFL